MQPKLREHERPPFGLTPEWLWLEQNPEPSLDQSIARIADLEAAITRYARAGKTPSPTWMAELNVRRLFAEYRVVP